VVNRKSPQQNYQTKQETIMKLLKSSFQSLKEIGRLWSILAILLTRSSVQKFIPSVHLSRAFTFGKWCDRCLKVILLYIRIFSKAIFASFFKECTYLSIVWLFKGYVTLIHLQDVLSQRKQMKKEFDWIMIVSPLLIEKVVFQYNLD